MATKIVLTPLQQSELRGALHVAVLDALLASRRWEPGQLIFQGGTSLHLMHGSPRHSEDLDFLVDSALDLENIDSAVHKHLKSVSWLPSGTRVSVNKAKAGHNPHAFVVTVGGENVIGSVKVKVELWQTDHVAMTPLRIKVDNVRLMSGPAAGAQAFVPREDLDEIYADKVFAVGARPYLKPRDLFDLHWILERHPDYRVSEKDLRLRLATYPNESAAAWTTRARDRAATMKDSAADVAVDLRKWLPTTWPMDPKIAAAIILASIAALEQGIDVMQAIVGDASSSRSARPRRGR